MIGKRNASIIVEGKPDTGGAKPKSLRREMKGAPIGLSCDSRCEISRDLELRRASFGIDLVFAVVDVTDNDGGTTIRTAVDSANTGVRVDPAGERNLDLLPVRLGKADPQIPLARA